MRASAFVLLSLCACAAPSASLSRPDAALGEATAPAPVASEPTADDIALVDAHGRDVRFFSDVVANHRVVVGFVYTRCTGVCPMQARRFADLRRALGDRRDVRLVLVSLDPEHDAPRDLAAYGAALGDDVVLLTGTRPAVDALVTLLVGAPIAQSAHSPFVVVGDGRAPWTRLYGLSSPRQILSRLPEAT
jgi:protein SCO1/2